MVDGDGGDPKKHSEGMNVEERRKEEERRYICILEVASVDSKDLQDLF